MADAAEVSDRMAELQRMRVALIIMLSQETSKLLSRRQRVAGKEIEVMCAERDLHDNPADERHQEALEAVYREDLVVKKALAETEAEIVKIEELVARVDADIHALCQS